MVSDMKRQALKGKERILDWNENSMLQEMNEESVLQEKWGGQRKTGMLRTGE